MNGKSLPKRVALFQHFLSHYREPIFNLLCRQANPDPEYVIFADTTNKERIKTIEYSKSQLSPLNGGLRWERIMNIWFGRTFLWQTAAVRVAKDRKFDCLILIGSMYHLSNWIAAIIARIKGKRVLMWTHGYLREERGIKGWFRERFYRLAHGLLLYGRRAQDLLLKRGFDPAGLYVVYNSLDFESQRRVRETITAETIAKRKHSLFTFPGLPVVIFVGRLTMQKKLLQLLQAVHMLREQGFNLNVLLVGDGPQRTDLQKFADTNSLANHVVFYGACYREEDLGPLIMLADIFVSPGEVGLACIHALTYGTPVITHGNPELQMPEWEAVQPGVTGDFFACDDVRDLARVIQKWLVQARYQAGVREQCQEIIERYYNPSYQVRIINEAVAGVPARRDRFADSFPGLADTKCRPVAARL
jgi:glycosyltransferase involved in cell wall biosynthesis